MARKPETAKELKELAPIIVDQNTWMYAERRGLCVVRQIRNRQGDLVLSDICYLPWPKIRRALAVKERAS